MRPTQAQTKITRNTLLLKEGIISLNLVTPTRTCPRLSCTSHLEIPKFKIPQSIRAVVKL
jgi:SUMO ligase MMS21 Smc5/6 complex component